MILIRICKWDNFFLKIFSSVCACRAASSLCSMPHRNVFLCLKSSQISCQICPNRKCNRCQVRLLIFFVNFLTVCIIMVHLFYMLTCWTLKKEDECCVSLSVFSVVYFSTWSSGMLETQNVCSSWWRSLSSSTTTTSASVSAKAPDCSLSMTVCWRILTTAATWRSMLDTRTAG